MRMDLTGQKFGLLTVLYRDVDKEKTVKNTNSYWCCKCDCGNLHTVRSSDLKSGKIKSCGCLKHKASYNAENLEGQTFSNLTVVRRIENRYGKRYWKCICKCGKEIEVSTSDLKNGHTKSCGCLKIERAKNLGYKAAIDLTNQKFGKLTALEPTNKRFGSSVVWKCKCDCGNISYVSAGDLRKKNNYTMSCGCTQSKGEFLISKILFNLGILFEKQKTFESCVNTDTNRKLLFDFFLPEQNILIEYDGIQHFKYFDSKKGWNNKKNFESTKKRDKIKNDWCKNNRIPLIRISYKEFDKLSENFLLERINNYEKYSIA